MHFYGRQSSAVRFGVGLYFAVYKLGPALQVLQPEAMFYIIRVETDAIVAE